MTESPPALGGPTVTDSEAILRFADTGDDLTGVRLAQHAGIPGEQLDFARSGDGWRLRLPRPRAWRLEYRLELHHRDGRVEEICDPANPLRAPGAFGDKSVLEFPDYRAPAWLDRPGVPGGVQQLTVPSRLLGANVEVRLWCPDGAGATEPLPLLVAHDGPEYANLAGLLQFAAAQIAAGRLPPHRVALLAPGERNEWYSANVGYARALALAVLPALRKAVRVHGPVAGMGASLGALAMMHTQRRHDTAFGGLFLQSGSFFDRRLDPQERGFARFTRVSRFVGDTLRHTLHPAPVPVTMTCGTAEENLANNRQYAAALAEERYPVRLIEVPDAHNYVAWRDAFDPGLVDLLGTVWA